MNNAQLIKTLAKKRTANFREDETRLLISLWGSPQIQNKLNLTHRKAPVMRLIAANMQQRGFYRSPDEIKTRIRNLKCLYHRIKRTITSGSGIGTVDPDWPHFKAMDAILGDSSSQSSKTTNGPSNGIKPDYDGNVDTHFEIKQEIDINDDLESWNGNESQGSDYDDDLGPASLPEPAITITTTPAPVKTSTANNNPPNIIQPKIVMGQAGNQITASQTTRTITCTPQTIRPTGQPSNLTLPSSIPLPFLILNNLKPAQTGLGNQNMSNSDGPPPNKRKKDSMDDNVYGNALHQLIDIQKQLLDVDKQRLEVEKQRLEFDRVVGSQLMTLVPMMGSLIQRLVFPQTDAMNKNFDIDQQSEENLDNNGEMQEINDSPDEATVQRTQQHADDELEKNRNILRNLLNQGLKARMMEDQRKEAEQQQQAEIEAAENDRIAGENDIDNEIEDNNIEETVDKDKSGEEELNISVTEEHENIENTIADDDVNENDDNESVCSVLLINENSPGTNDDEQNDE